jgi:hypothetical protein
VGGGVGAKREEERKRDASVIYRFYDILLPEVHLQGKAALCIYTTALC